MTAVTLIALRRAVAEHLAGWWPKAEVKTGPGRMSEAEIRTMAAKAPAVRVAVLGLPRGEDVGDGEVDRDVMVAVYVLTADRPALPRDDAALAMVDDLQRRLPGARWGLSSVHGIAAETVRADNLYSSTLGQTGIALWAVVWTQRIRQGVNAYPDGPILADEAYHDGEDAP